MRSSVTVHTYLLEQGIPHEFFHPARPLHDVSDLPYVLGVEPEDCVRVRLYDARGGPIACILPVNMEGDLTLVAEAAGVPEARSVSSAYVSRITGFPAQWAPPLAHERPARVLIDKSLVEREVIYAPAGEPGLVLKMRAADLIETTGALPVLLGQRVEA